MSEVKAVALDPDSIEFKFEITFTLGEWKKISNSMHRNWCHPMSRLSESIRHCTDQAEKVYRPINPNQELQRVSKEIICRHDNFQAHWDYCTCPDCGWMKPSGQAVGKHFGWFPSRDAAEEFRKYKAYPYMNEVKPTRRY